MEPLKFKVALNHPRLMDLPTLQLSDIRCEFTTFLYCCSANMRSPTQSTGSKKRSIDSTPPSQENGREREYKYPAIPNSKKTKGQQSPASKPSIPRANVSSPRKDPKPRKARATSQVARTTASTQHSHWNGPLTEIPVPTAVARGPVGMSTEAEMRGHPLTASLFMPSLPVQSPVQSQAVAATVNQEESSTDAITPEETTAPAVVQRKPVREVRNLLEESDEEQVEMRTKFAAMTMTPKEEVLPVKAPGLAASKFAIKPTPPASVASSTPAASQTGRVHESATSSEPAFWAWKATQVPKSLIRSGY